MNCKLIIGLVAITGLLALPAIGQVTVSTTATNASLQEPYNVVEDATGDLFISDSANDRVVRLDASTGLASVLAGVTGVTGSNDGPSLGANAAHFFNPQGLLVVSIGRVPGLLVADSGNNLIRFVRFSDGYVTTVAGQNLVFNGTTNEIGANATFNQPVGMDQDTNGNVYIADEFQNAIRVINLQDPLFGVTNLTFTDGTTFRRPNAIAFAGPNQLWVADSQNNSVKLLALATPAAASLTTCLGANSSHGSGAADSGIGSSARFNNPGGLLWIPNLGLMISDTGNNSLRLATNNPAYGASNYAVTTYAGLPGTAGFANGSASSATFNQPEGLCLDPANGAFLVADLRNNAIRSLKYTAPRPAVPVGVQAAAEYGTVILAWNSSLNASNYNVKRSPTHGGPYAILGNVSATNFTDATVLNGTTYYYVISALNASGESANSVEVAATPPVPPLNAPQGLALDSQGTTLFIADFGSNSIHRLDLNDNLTSTFLAAVDGITHPASVLVDTNDDVYVLNQNAGTNGTILEFDAFGNLLATNLTGLNQPTAFTMDGNGNIFIAELGGAVKVLFPSGLSNTIVTLTPNSVTLSTNVQLQGIAAFDDGVLALSDSGNQVIWTLNPITKQVLRLTGQLGATGTTLGASNLALLNQPHQLARAGNNQLVIADYGNNRLVTATRSGAITNVLASTNSQVWLGLSTDPSAGNTVAISGPMGVAVSASGHVFDSEPTNALVRELNAAVTSPPATAPVVDLPFYGVVQGLAFDSVDNLLFIADTANNAVQRLDLNNNATTTFLTAANGLAHPVSVVLDTNNNVYVLNQGSGGNGFVLKFDIHGNAYGPILAGLNQPTAVTMDGTGTLFVTERGGTIRGLGTSFSNIVATVTNAGVALQGIALFDDGTIVVSDAGNNVLWTINPITKLISQLTGQFGTNAAVGGTNFANLSQPQQLARVAGNQIVAADYGNSRLVLVERDGTIITNDVNYQLNSSLGNVWFGQAGDPVTSDSPRFVPMVSPVGVAAGNNNEIFTSETYFDDIRGLTGTGVKSATFTPEVPIPYYLNAAGVTLNNEGTVLYVTDLTNNTVSALNLANNQTTIILDSSSGIYQPVDVASDSSDNLYVLNQGAGGNGSIMEFDQFGNFLGTNASSLAFPTAMKLDFTADIFVSELNGLVQEYNASGSNTLANITTNANVRLEGIAVLDNGAVVVSDAGNHVLWKIPGGVVNTNAVLFAGVLGASGTNFGGVGAARLNQPMRLAQAFGGLLLIADSGNNRVVVANDSGTISTALATTNATLWFGLPIDPVGSGSPYFVPMLAPIGLALGPKTASNAVVYTSESIYKDVRGMVVPGIIPPTPPPPAPLNLVATASYGQVTLTWSAALGATNYNVLHAGSSGGPYTVIDTTALTTFTDTELGGSLNYYVVSAVNASGAGPNSAEVHAVPLIPPPPAPTIGWFDYEPPSFPLTVIHSVAIATYNNDQLLAIDPVTNGVSTYYTTDGSTPSQTNGSTPPFYKNGLGYAVPLPAAISPTLLIKAVNFDSIGQASPVTTAQFLFQAANPTIVGNNAGQFSVSDLTTNAQLYYTVDGTDPVSPTNGTSTIGPIALNSDNSATLSLLITSNTLFKVSAYRQGYAPSGIAAQSFSISNFVANTLSFGFAAGEASSAFIASPGQTFYAPVTLGVLPATKIYSLQFDVTVTNAGPTIVTTTVTNTVTNTVSASTNIFATTVPGLGITITNTFGTNLVTTSVPTATNTVGGVITTTAIVTNLTVITATTIITNGNGTNTIVTTTVSTTSSTTVTTTITNFPNPGPAITPDAFSFQSMLLKPDPLHQGFYITIPPYMFINNDTGPLNPAQIVTYEGTNFVDLLTTDTALNLLSVGWLEVLNETNLYVTTSQDLIQYSKAHDDFYQQSGGQVIVGGYAFTVPATAAANQTYQIQISRASATSDGVGAPGSDVYIAMPTNGATGGGSPVNALKFITVGQIKYLAGSVYPFRWFNAGDFGSTNIVNADVEQVFQSAIYQVDYPPAGSDFFDAMDSCGGTYVDLGNGYLEFNTFISGPNATSPLFGGDDTSINQIAFGDGVLDVCDVYVTFRRSLDPSLTWFERYWNNGQRVAIPVANVANHASKAPAAGSQPTSKALNTSAVAPQVNFSAGDIIGSAGQTVSVPINANIVGTYPLRVLMLNLSVTPLDGSPALTSAVSFNQMASALGAPYTSTSGGNGNFAAVWLNSTNPGLTGTVTLGTLTVTLPSSAGNAAAYAIHFDHASASPNGLASFPNSKLTGLLTTSARTNSTYGDGIPDSWRLRWFGTVNNLLSASNACPSGDGVPNWQKYIAGVDPNVANDFPRLNSKTPIPSGFTTAIHWPSVYNTQYVIQRANSLFGSPWTILSTNAGTGGDMEYDDTNAASLKFYRVEILPGQAAQ